MPHLREEQELGGTGASAPCLSRSAAVPTLEQSVRERLVMLEDFPPHQEESGEMSSPADAAIDVSPEQQTGQWCSVRGGESFTKQTALYKKRIFIL